MGKKFIVLQSMKKKYRLYSEDIKKVFPKAIRKLPTIPAFASVAKAYES